MHQSLYCVLFCILIGITNAALYQTKVVYLAKKWAPVIKLAKGERWNPSSVEYFLRHVKMLGCDCQPYPITPFNLKTCSRSYLTTQTKLSCAACTNPSILRGQKPSQAPVYTMIREQGQYVDIIYWVFFPYNRGKKVCIGLMIYNMCLGKYFSFGHHVGDWEHVTVRFKNYKVYSIYMKVHDEKITQEFGGEFLWNGTAFRKGSKSIQMLSRSHAVVYAAQGSHGMWSSSGVHTYIKLPNGAQLNDKCSNGISWYTWKRLKLFQYRSDDNYQGEFSFVGFKGFWGNEKRGCLVEWISGECVLNSGPTGPIQKSFIRNGKLG